MVARIAAAIAAWCCCTMVVMAQTESEADTTSSSEWFRIYGSASISADFYDAASSADSMGAPIWSPRRPANLYRLLFTPTITLFDRITIPITLVLTSTETNTITPSTLSPSLTQFFTNPLNALSISFKPGVEWAEFQLGTHVPRYSDLLGSDVQVFGAGFSAQPGFVRLGYNTGIVQRAVAADTTRNITGAYSRRLHMAKLGVGNGTKWFVDLNMMTMRDDTSDLAPGLRPLQQTVFRSVGEMDTTTGITPYTETYGWGDLAAEEGVIFSTAFRAEVTDEVALVGEIAAGAVTRDVSADLLEDAQGYVPTWLITPRITTKVDGAATFGVLVNDVNWGIETRIKYVGPGYRPFGIPFMQSDYLDITVSPRLALMDNALTINGTVGSRTFNFSSQTDEDLAQLIISLNANYILDDRFSIAGSFSNFGIRNGTVNDTLRIQNVARSILLSPTYTLPTPNISHSITLSLTLDQFQDFNVVSGRLADNNTIGAFATYTATFLTMPLTTFGSLNYMRNDLPEFGFTMSGVTIGASYGFLENTLTPSLAFTLGSNALGNNSADLQFLIRGGLRWAITERLAFTVNATTNTYSYGSSLPGAHFTENTVQLMLTQSF